MKLLFVMLFSLPAYASFCDEGSRREGNTILICGSAESPVRPQAESLTRDHVLAEFSFTMGTSKAKYHVNPRRLVCEKIHSNLYGPPYYWRCMRLVEFILEEK